jgi:hypothetical protein
MKYAKFILFFAALGVLEAQPFSNGGITAYLGVNLCGTESGSANAYICSVPNVPSGFTFSPQDGAFYEFKAAHANSSASTLNLNGSGAIAIMRLGGGTALTNGDILANQDVIVQYESICTCYQMQSQTADSQGITRKSFTGSDTTLSGFVNFKGKTSLNTTTLTVGDSTAGGTATMPGGTYNVVGSGIANTYTAGYQDFKTSAGARLPSIAFGGFTNEGDYGYDYSLHGFHFYHNGADQFLASLSGTEALQGKTLCDGSDVTKCFAFSSSGFGTGRVGTFSASVASTDKTWTFPNTTGNVVVDAASNTFTGTNTFTSATVVLPNQAGLGPTTTGAVGYTTNFTTPTFGDGTTAKLLAHKLVCTNGASATLTDSTTGAQTFSTTCTIPANYLIAGTTVEVNASYQITTPASAVSGFQFVLQLNGVNIYATPANQVPTNSLTSRGGHAHFVIQGTAAASGAANVNTGGDFFIPGLGAVSVDNAVAQPVSVATNASGVLQMFIIYGTAASTSSITQLIFTATADN